MIYDALGRRTNTIDRLGRVTQYFYDADGELTNTIYPDLATNSTVYDQDGRVQYIIDARGFANAFGYDQLGRQTQVTNGYNTPIAMVTQYGYDANGHRTNTVDALTHTNSYQYDVLNRVVTNSFPDGSTQSMVYDQDGRKISQTDQAGKTTRFAYDALGRLTYVTNALNKTTAYAYDEVGNQTNQVDALSHTTTFEYDALGRRTKRTLPGTQYETFIYDAVGNILVHSNFNGLAITNSYDSMNRLTSRSNGTTRLEFYVYDPAGQLTNRIDTSGTYTWTFDSRGRVTNNTTPVGALVYGYDASGNQTSLASTTSGGVNLIYQYDALNRLTNVLDVNLGMSVTNTAYTYDGVGNLQTMRYPNGVSNLWVYDSINRLTGLSCSNGASLASFSYQLGPAGNRTNLSEKIGSASRTFAWAYDNLYRLTNETATGSSPTGALTYGYDDVGNRLTRTTNSGFPILTNQSFTFNNNDWLNSDSYDSNGNTTNSASVGYSYDYADRLTNSGSIDIIYDADGNRIQKVASTTTVYLVSTVNPTGYPQVVEEFSVTGPTNLSKVYTYGLSLISQRQVSETYFFGFDGHGSARFLTDTNGSNVNSFTYDAYGNLIASNSAPQTSYLYSGEQFDADLGFYYLRARYLSPNTGRFWTMDAFQGNNQDPSSLHKYLYCNADGVNKSDPSGHGIGDVVLTTSIIVYLTAQCLAPELTALTIVGSTLIVAKLVEDPQFRVEFAEAWMTCGVAFPIQVEEVYGEIRTLNMARRAAPIIESTEARGFLTSDQALIKEAREIFHSSSMTGIKAAQKTGQTIRAEINGYTIQYQKGLPFSGMTWKDQNGFILSDEAFASEEELAKTIAHELYRLKNGLALARGSVTAASAKEETAAAYSFAERAYSKVKE